MTQCGAVFRSQWHCTRPSGHEGPHIATIGPYGEGMERWRWTTDADGKESRSEMAFGPGGKYDDQCTAVMMATAARAVALMVLDGRNGSGFSVVTMDPQVLNGLPDMLEGMARDIRASLSSAGTKN